MKKNLLRVVDVNFNRSKEGLRVIEDIFRFVFEDNSSRRKVRTLRHALDAIAQDRLLKEAILNRDSNRDIGKKIDNLETKRSDAKDILYINFQRVKESLRVLEEFFKILLPNRVSEIKKLRYKVYTLEKDTRKKYK
ncbi:MAG: thiamine-phosphate pyrophosphorylase [Candidatus Omnitrophica bacterium]|nr:thiamine-phosphate pyrophosphorylase [Candidatus Omnitrophota bacterium]